MAEQDRPGYSFTPGPPPEASRYLRNKGLQPAFSWADVEPEEHAVAFSVAKATSLDVLTTIREEVQRALDEGLPFESFRNSLTPRLQELGWWGYGETRDPRDGSTRAALQGTPRRLRTIYDANLRSARAAGQWERIQRTKRALPYLTYRLGPSEHHREHHETKAGLTLPVDDPFWDEWMPPNGWGCKCWVRQISREEAESIGISESPSPRYRTWTNHRTGEVKRVPVGIDPGWERNPGARRLQAIEDLLDGRLAAAPPAVARTALRDVATSWRVRRILKGSAPGSAPVTVLDPALAGAIGSETPVVRISRDTAIKQSEHHPEITPPDYRQLAALLEHGHVRRQDRNLVFVEDTDDLPWIAAIKRTADGRELYLTTLYRAASRRYVRRLMERGETIR